MPVQFLETKFHIPPVRPEYVHRPRLIERLNDGLHRKLTLVSAPAGFGKTSLISAWIAESDRQSAWLSLDKRDNDPIRFLSYLIGALQSTTEKIGDEALGLVQSAPQTSPETVLTSLINEVASIPTAITLAIDDYYLIEDDEIDEMMDFLIEHLPSQMHVVISTREDPQLALARLRASGQLNELRASDLRFLTTEITKFLNEGMKFDLSADDIELLEQRTEGWIASLQLAALSIQKQNDATGFIKSFTGSHRLVLDYLIEEVFINQTDEVQQFLMRTSILDRMCGPLCNELTNRQNGQNVLQVLDNSNLFIVPLDDERRWYRYHHLFAELLRQRLQDTYKESVPEIHGKAGRWYAQNGFDYEAIEHALQARDFPFAAGLMEAYLGDNFERINQTTRERWLAEFQGDFKALEPYLVLLEAWTLLVGGRLDEAERCLNAAEAMQTPAKDGDRKADENETRIMARTAALRCWIAEHSSLLDLSGDYSQCIRYGHRALEYLEEGDSIWRCLTLMPLSVAYTAESRFEDARQAQIDAVSAAQSSQNAFLIMTANLRMADVLRQQGKLKETLAICRHVLSDARNNGMADRAEICWPLGIYSEVLAETNSVELALDQAREAAIHAARCRDFFYIGYSISYLIRTFFTCGDMAGARNIIQIAENLADRCNMPPSAMIKPLAWKARIWLAEGQIESARQWAEERDINQDDEPSHLHEPEYLVLVRIRLAEGRPDEALRLLQWCGELITSSNRVATEIEHLSLQALAHHAAGNVTEAIECLRRALSLAEPEGFVRIFVDEGPPMAGLLYEAALQDIRPEYIRLILDAFPVPETEPADSRNADSHHADLPERLSDRELDVLRLVAEGMSNEQIGEKLFISIHTVKVHTRNIYAKLDTHNRTEAVARARYYGILSSD